MSHTGIIFTFSTYIATNQNYEFRSYFRVTPPPRPSLHVQYCVENSISFMPEPNNDACCIIKLNLLLMEVCRFFSALCEDCAIENCTITYIHISYIQSFLLHIFIFVKSYQRIYSRYREFLSFARIYL